MDADLSLFTTFEDARPLGLGDEAFVSELYDVLHKHGNLGRFGLCLLHDHFDVAGDEILLESNDPGTRTLNLEVIKKGDLPPAKFTSWRIGGANAEALTACAQDKCKVERDPTPEASAHSFVP
jgi:hypothetical protein